MNFEQRSPVVLVCCGSFNPITVGHLKMFEIARDFLERTGNHIVIGGIISPVHDDYKKAGLISSSHRSAMCKLATKKHFWLSVDTWESSQANWVKTVKVLQHISNKIKNDYGVLEPYSNSINFVSEKYPRSTVTLQPNGTLKHRVTNSRSFLNNTRHGFLCSRTSDLQEGTLELNEASEVNETGVVLNRLSNNLQKVCCIQPTPLALHDNMVYGAAYDLRRTKVMLLCGSDLLESFGIPDLWSDEDISEIVSQFGIVCIPRSSPKENDDDGKLMRDALDRMQRILCQVHGTVILVNDRRRSEIAHVSSSKCRSALQAGYVDNARKLLHPAVLNYISDHRLYVNSEKAGG